MSDINIRRDTELMVASVQGFTPAAVDFVEAIAPVVAVIDADRVIVRDAEVPDVHEAALLKGLSVSNELVERLQR